MNDSFFVWLGLLAVAAFVLGPIAFFLTLGARTRLSRLEHRFAELERAARVGVAAEGERAESGEAASAARPAAANIADAGAAAPPTQPDEAPPKSSEGAKPDAAEGLPLGEGLPAAPPQPLPGEPAPAAPQEPAPPKPKLNLEELLGTRWAVIVGGIALALGALLLVKYSLDQGFFGPGLRVLAGLALGAGLVAAGEYMRRRDGTAGPSPQAVPIPAVLTGVGTIAAFGSLYAAHALYGFIGPGMAFALMGLLGVATMLAAALHGPALAGLGLVGALGAPLLVTSNDHNPWPVVLFVAMVCAAAYALARVRRWLWLAIAAGIGATLWQGLLLLGIDGANGIDFSLASLAHLLIESALALIAFVVAPHLFAPQDGEPTDFVSSAAALACMAVAIIVFAAEAQQGGSGPAWILAAAVVAAMLGLTGFRFPAAAVASAGAGAVILAALTVWGINSGLITLPYRFVMEWPPTDSASPFVIFGLAASSALTALCAWRLWTLPSLSFANAALYAGAGALTPLGAVSLLYLRLTGLESSRAFAATACVMSALMGLAAERFLRRRVAESPPAVTLGLGAFAAGALAALSLALVFELSEGTLTVALALAALGCAFTDDRFDIPALRQCVIALGLAVGARFLWEPRIVGDALGATPIFNWLLFGYGVPALAFGVAARILRRRREDVPVRVAQAASILCAAMLATLEIRHALTGGHPFAQQSGMVEQGLFAVTGMMFSLVLLQLNARRADPLYRAASLGFAALTLGQALIGLLILENPFFTGAPIDGGAVFNGLILGYLLPALAAFALAWASRGAWPPQRWLVTQCAAMVLLFAYLNLELRRLFQGTSVIGLDAPTGDGEFYAYSALWLALGVLLLAYGILAASRPARLASAVAVSMTVLKVFLLDMSGLEGALRAFSFLGLGAALIGIGLVYQKFLLAGRPGR